MTEQRATPVGADDGSLRELFGSRVQGEIHKAMDEVGIPAAATDADGLTFADLYAANDELRQEINGLTDELFYALLASTKRENLIDRLHALGTDGRKCWCRPMDGFSIGSQVFHSQLCNEVWEVIGKRDAERPLASQVKPLSQHEPGQRPSGEEG